MITPEKFAELWSIGPNELVRYPPSEVQSLSVSQESKSFLIKAGLPKDAPPFLSFGFQFAREVLVPVSKAWGLPLNFSCYRILGCTGSGDPICIDESTNGVVVYLNHDRDFKRIFMNTSIAQLAECLLAYRDFVNQSINKRGTDAYIDGNIPETAKEWLANQIRTIDAPALHKESFWGNELRALRT